MIDFKAIAATRPRLLTALTIAGAIGAGGVILPPLAAFAQDNAMHGGMSGEGHGGMHAMMAGHLDRMLVAVDATPEQKARIQAILGGAMGPMGAAHHQMHERMEQLHALLTAPTIDRAAVERLRAAGIADLDAHSRTLIGAMADAAEVLTPAQRAKLGAMMRDHAPG